MAREDKAARAARSGNDAADTSPEATDTSPEATGSKAEPTDDTEGHTFLPDRSGEYLAGARERDIRQHLSRRELENASKKQKRR